MEVRRRGLRMLNSLDHVGSKQGDTLFVKKAEPVDMKFTSKTTLVDKSATVEVAPFRVFRDPVDTVCQHCGSHRRSGVGNAPVSRDCRDSATQVEDIDLHAWLCSENPPEKYWEAVAEQRRVALKETLDENMQLCALVEKLNVEIERLCVIAGHADHFASMYNMVKENEAVDSCAPVRSPIPNDQLDRAKPSC